MTSRLHLLSLLGSIALAIPSCDSSDPTLTQPQQEKPEAAHRSTATLQIHYTHPFWTGSPGEETSNNFLNTQIAILSANGVITEAAEQGDLDSQTIKDALWIEAIPDTDLITLSAYHDDLEIAKRIAKSVITAYISRRDLLDRRRSEQALEALDLELMKQADLVQDYRKALTVLIQQYGIPYFEGRSENPVGTTEEEMYRLAQMKLDEYETQNDQLKIQNQSLLNTSPDDLVRAAASLDLPNNPVTGYYTAYREYSEKINVGKASGLGQDHPEIVKLQQQADQALEQARREVPPLKEVLKTKEKLLDRQVERMREIVSSKQVDTVELSLKQHTYNQAKEEYEQAREMYREMRIKQQEARVMLQMPRTSVTIHGWEHQ